MLIPQGHILVQMLSLVGICIQLPVSCCKFPVGWSAPAPNPRPLAHQLLQPSACHAAVVCQPSRTRCLVNAAGPPYPCVRSSLSRCRDVIHPLDGGMLDVNVMVMECGLAWETAAGFDCAYTTPAVILPLLSLTVTLPSAFIRPPAYLQHRTVRRASAEP